MMNNICIRDTHDLLHNKVLQHCRCEQRAKYFEPKAWITDIRNKEEVFIQCVLLVVAQVCQNQRGKKIDGNDKLVAR